MAVQDAANDPFSSRAASRHAGPRGAGPNGLVFWVMLPALFRDAQARLALIREGRKQAGEIGPGLAASLLLHGFALLAVLFFMLHTAGTPQPKEAPLIPIDVVRLGDGTASPPAEKKARVPLAKALPGPRQEEQSPVKPEGYSPKGTRAPVDALDRQLRSLAHLRLPETDLHVTPDIGPSNEAASSDDAAAGDEATYSVRDYVRAQVNGAGISISNCWARAPSRSPSTSR